MDTEKKKTLKNVAHYSDVIIIREVYVQDGRRGCPSITINTNSTVVRAMHHTSPRVYLLEQTTESARENGMQEIIQKQQSHHCKSYNIHTRAYEFKS